MKQAIRLALVGCASFLALAFAGPALAAYAPRIVVTTTTDAAGNPATTITVAQTPEEDPAARIVIYAPPAFAASLSQAAGTQIGTVTGRVQAADLGGAIVPVEGTVTVASAAQATAFSAAAAACLGTATHEAVWLLNLAAGGQSLPSPVPVFVDRTTGVEQAIGSLKLQICLPPGDVPAGTPGRAVLGIKLVESSLTLRGVFQTPATPGEYRWTGIFTPYTPRTGRPNIAGTVQSQAVVRSPARLTLTGRRVVQRVSRKSKRTRTFARLTGLLRAGGEPVAGARVDILVGNRRVARATTGANGSFRVTIRLTRTTTFRARATAAASSETGGCTPPIPLPTGGAAACTTVTVGAVSATSNTARVTVPRKARARR